MKRAAIILASGEGTRLAELTRRADGVHVPKQFCGLFGKPSLLEQTRRRVSRSVAQDRVSFVLNKAHERFFSSLLAGVPPARMVVQPRNRGAGPAILYSLLRLAQWAPEASVLLIPSDHHVADEERLMKYVDLVFAAVEANQQLIVLLGISADEPETGYGWIESGPPSIVAQANIYKVQGFWEKPSRELALRLLARRCLWNSLMLVGQLSRLFELFILTVPELHVSFSKIRLSLGTVFEEESARRLYDELRTLDFSRDVLQSVPQNLSVLPVSGVGWSDLAEPHRVTEALARYGAQQKEALG